jgi:hypothetical protein
VPQHEPDLGVIKRPDYLIERDGYMCVCEVKEFANGTASFRGAGGTTSPEVVLSPMRSQIPVFNSACAASVTAGVGSKAEPGSDPPQILTRASVSLL